MNVLQTPVVVTEHASTVLVTTAAFVFRVSVAETVEQTSMNALVALVKMTPHALIW